MKRVLFSYNKLFSFVSGIALTFFSTLLLLSCTNSEDTKSNVDTNEVFLSVLGNVQDGGLPHIGCTKNCCRDFFNDPSKHQKVTCLGLIDKTNHSTFLFEASPDFPTQLAAINQLAEEKNDHLPNAVFLTHAHIGHYSGLMYLGREAMGAKAVKIYAMPRMAEFLLANGPWSQLIKLNNISIDTLQNEAKLKLSNKIEVTPFLVPHRDEFSETVGFFISGPNKKVLFIPDIDKWSKWDKNIAGEISKVDYAFIDATFYDNNEIPNRDISEIPHPFVIESMELFKNLSPKQKSKIYFIHMNHSNPMLDEHSQASKVVEECGFHVARVGQKFPL